MQVFIYISRHKCVCSHNCIDVSHFAFNDSWMLLAQRCIPSKNKKKHYASRGTQLSLPLDKTYSPAVSVNVWHQWKMGLYIQKSFVVSPHSSLFFFTLMK